MRKISLGPWLVCLLAVCPTLSAAQVSTTVSGSATNDYSAFGVVLTGCEPTDVYGPVTTAGPSSNAVSNSCVPPPSISPFNFLSQAAFSATGAGNSVSAYVTASASVSGSPTGAVVPIGTSAGGSASASSTDILAITQGGLFSVRRLLRSQISTSQGCQPSEGYEQSSIQVGVLVGGFQWLGVGQCSQSALDEASSVSFSAGAQVAVTYFASATAVAQAVYPQHPKAFATADASQTFYLVITPITPGAAFTSRNGIDYSRLPPDLEVQHQYQFSGFSDPIHMAVTNTVKAGRVIPVIWRLTDLQGSPISDPGSFVGVSSFQTSCSNESIDTEATDAYAAGSSGLQYLGDGLWQFNWQTPESFAGQCRRMYVKLNDGQASAQVAFQFK